MKTIITEGTLLPVSLIAVIVGGGFWLGGLESDTRANAREISKLQEQYSKVLNSIDQRLSYIEGKLSLHEQKR